MITDQDFQKLSERVAKLEEEVVRLQADSDWESKVAEFIKKGDMNAAVSFYQDRVDRHASMSEAVGHVMEIKKKIGK